MVELAQAPPATLALLACPGASGARDTRLEGLEFLEGLLRRVLGLRGWLWVSLALFLEAAHVGLDGFLGEAAIPREPLAFARLGLFLALLPVPLQLVLADGCWEPLDPTAGLGRLAFACSASKALGA